MYSGIFGAGASFNLFLQETFSLSYTQTSFFDILSFQGGVFVSFCAFYPYVYLSTKAALKQESSSLLETARIQGMGEFSIFFKLILPLLRPSIVIGLSFVIMESISDFGVADYCGIETMVIGIFRTWEGMQDLMAAAKLSALLMIIILAVFYIENWQRGKRGFASSAKNLRPITPKKLPPIKSFFAFLFCFFPVLVGFLVPMFFLIKWFFMSLELIDEEYFTAFINTAKISLISSLLIVFFAIIFAYFLHAKNDAISKLGIHLSKLGYAVAGAVIAMGIIVVLTNIDKLQLYFFDTNFLISASIIALIYGYCVRFLAVGLSNIEGSMAKIPPSYDDAAKVMGYAKLATFMRVKLPILKATIGISLIIVLIEILKELPLTLILRPFNFQNLATMTYEFNFQEMLIESSVSAISIVFLALISVIILIQTTIRK